MVRNCDLAMFSISVVWYRHADFLNVSHLISEKGATVPDGADTQSHGGKRKGAEPSHCPSAHLGKKRALPLLAVEGRGVRRVGPCL